MCASLSMFLARTYLQTDMHPRVGVDQVDGGVGYSIIDGSIVGKGNQSESTVKLWVQLVCKVCREGFIPGLICCLTAPHGMYANLDHTAHILLHNESSIARSCVLTKEASAGSLSNLSYEQPKTSVAASVVPVHRQRPREIAEICSSIWPRCYASPCTCPSSRFHKRGPTFSTHPTR